MPNYRITIYFKSGIKKFGIRYHASHDIHLIRSLALEKQRKAAPADAINYIDVEPTALGDQMNVKNL